MTTRQRTIDSAAARGRAANAQILQDLRNHRLDRGIAGADLARVAGISPSQYSRIERGLSGPITIQQACTFFAVLGYDLSIALYPGGQPLRDRVVRPGFSGDSEGWFRPPRSGL